MTEAPSSAGHRKGARKPAFADGIACEYVIPKPTGCNPSLPIALNGTSQSSSGHQNRVTGASEYQDQREVERPGVADLVGDREYDGGQHEVQQDSIVARG